MEQLASPVNIINIKILFYSAISTASQKLHPHKFCIAYDWYPWYEHHCRTLKLEFGSFNSPNHKNVQEPPLYGVSRDIPTPYSL